MRPAIRGYLGRLSSQNLSAGFLSSRILVPMAVMCLYFVSSSLLLPSGVNKVFVTRSATVLVPVTILLWLGFLILARLGWIPYRPSTLAEEGPTASDLPLLLLPLAPVVQYILLSADILSLRDSFLILAFFSLASVVLIFAIPLLFRRTGSTRPLMYLGIAFAFLLANMATLSKEFRWHDWVSLKVLIPIFAGVWFLSWLLYRLKMRVVLSVTIAAFLLVNTIVQLNAREGADSQAEPHFPEGTLASMIGPRRPSVTPGIYLLVYDSYVVSETMAAYGIDNLEQERYLEQTGFKIYPHTYSLAPGSLKAMSRVLNASADYVLDRDGRAAVSGSGTVQQLLDGFGYETYGVFPSDFFFRGTVPGYDYSFPRAHSSAGLLIGAILEGEFRFDAGFDDVTREQYTNEKERIFSGPPEAPRFVYSHSSLPGHSQTTCLPNETELFGEDVAKANLEMRRDVEAILQQDPDAIIIIAGDHGPRLTKNCTGTEDDYELSEISRMDIQDRFGTFLAIRWPDEGFEEYDEITVLQDLFPSVFAYMFADADLLQSFQERTTTDSWAISGAQVVDGMIVGGIDDGEPLFIGSDER